MIWLKANIPNGSIYGETKFRVTSNPKKSLLVISPNPDFFADSIPFPSNPSIQKRLGHSGPDRLRSDPASSIACTPVTPPPRFRNEKELKKKKSKTESKTPSAAQTASLGWSVRFVRTSSALLRDWVRRLAVKLAVGRGRMDLKW